MGSSQSLSRSSAGGRGSCSSSDEDDDELDVHAGATRSSVIQHVCGPKDPKKDDTQAVQVLLPRKIDSVVDKEEICPSTVLLHVYDINETLQVANQLLAFTIREAALGGAFHVGVEVFGAEWSYGVNGVSSSTPRTVDGHVYRGTVILGRTTLIDFTREVHVMCRTWLGSEYDLIGQNCCSFAAALCQRLGVGPLPPWVDRFARALQSGRAAGRGVVEASRAVGQAWRGGAKGLANQPASGITGAAGDHPHDPRQASEASENSLPRLDSGADADLDFGTSVSSLGLCPCFSEQARLPASPARQRTSRLPSSCCSLGPTAGESEERDSASGEDVGPAAVDSTGADSLNPREGNTCEVGLTPCSPSLAGLDGPSCHELQRPEAPQARKIDNLLLPVGLAVEYESASAGDVWIPTTVTAFHPESGLFDLACKPQVIRRKIRRLEAFPLGADIEYRSTLTAVGWRWIRSKVRSFDPSSGLYDLDCKSRVPRGHIRLPECSSGVAPD